MVSHLTSSIDSLTAGSLSDLSGDGYPFNGLTTNLDQFLAATLSDLTGTTYSHLTTPRAELLARLRNALDDGSSSALIMSVAEILAGIVNAPPVEEEGGGAPEWLPEGALEYSDFANAHYYADGAETTLGAMWVEYAPHAPFSASDVVAATGLYAESAARGPLATGANLTGAMVGRTFVVNFTVTEFGTVYVWHLDEANLEQRATNLEGPDGNTIITSEVDTVFFDPLTIGAHKAAVTLTPTKIAMSIDGGVTQFLTSAASCTKFALRVTDDAIIASLTAFTVVDDAALPALSAIEEGGGAPAVTHNAVAVTHNAVAVTHTA